MTSPLPATSAIPAPTTPRPLRLWPGVVLVALQWALRFVLPVIMPAALPIGVMAGMVCGLAVILWWLFFSRARWADRLGAVAVMVVGLALTMRVVHPSISGGMMGYLIYVYSLPVLCLALVAWAAATQHMANRPRRATMVVALLAACSIFTILRTGGMTSAADSDFHFRWTPTPEERLLAEAKDKSRDPGARGAATSTATAATTALPTAAAANVAAHWPGFRGPGRDSILRGVKIETNWSASPPVELWRRPVGPGWSSFAVSGNLVYTQEQRGEDEVVACYNLTTGEPVWLHRDATRFYESNAGPGPRSTPTLHEGRVYTFGATGVANALDALSGTVVWSRNATDDTRNKDGTKKTAPEWGFASSPLVVGDLVLVAATGSLLAFDLATGKTRWTGPDDGNSYSSPHLAEIEGTRQILLMSGKGRSFAPADGKVLWQHAWPSFAIVQPAQIANGEFVISTGDRLGARRIAVTQKDNAWTVEERWTSTRLKAYFNDYVLHRGHAYGFDGGILACVDVATGERAWKGGRYGSGQLILLADQDLLIVLSEQGEVALVPAKPGEFTELARIKALEGKTWNHPVLAGNTLLVRNDQEMVAYKLVVSASNVAQR